MAEQFLSRLNKIEESINQLGETLKRMITILGTVTEIKSEIRVAKDAILQSIANQPAPAIQSDNSDELAKMVVQEVGAVRVFVQESMENLKNDMTVALGEMVESITSIAAAPASPQVIYAPKPEVARSSARAPPQETPTYDSSSIPVGRAMQVADQLEKILDSLKMGCISGDVLDAMVEAKTEIMKIVPSDPIMVKLDKWSGLVGSYPKRNELQARDVIKLKKDLKDEIPKYRPA